MLLLIAGCGGSPPPPIPLPPCPGEPGATQLTAPPYLQAMEPTAVTVLWETDAGAESTLWYGPDLASRACGTLAPALGRAPTLHRVRLEGLEPGTRYEYRVQTGSIRSEVLAFTTPVTSPSTVRLVALADSQRDEDHPAKLREIVREGVLPTTRERYQHEPDGALDAVLFAGDLVDDGYDPSDWSAFFHQGAPLFGRVPLLPVLGNREANSPLFFRYFELPLDEHVYTVDRGPVRIIGLDSNEPYRTSNQLDWLAGVLAATCDDPSIRVVFAQLHHPHLSELWSGAETAWTEGVVDQLATFSGTCGKPSIQFHGHTHGYARGSDAEHRHLMLDVASAGGRLDRWGRDSQQDREAIAVSDDAYGFVLVEVDASGLELRRYSRGDPEAPLENVLVDRVYLPLVPHPPERPTVHWACEDPPRAVGSPFVDPDDGHQATTWERTDCTGQVLETRWIQRENRYGGVDLQAHDDLTDTTFDESGPLCVRVRYRDAGFVWSPWSEVVERTCP